MTRWRGALVSILVLLLVSVVVGAAPLGRAPLLMPGKQTLYQRVLTRPGTELVATPGAPSGTLVDAFSRFYVYGERTVDSRRWLEVGVDTLGGVRGWLPAERTVPWKQQMTLAFTNPGASRDRVLFFEDRTAIEALMVRPDAAAQVRSIEKTIAGGGRDDRIVAIEPNTHIDINKQFYLLPILDFDEIYLDSGHTLRTLQVASITKSDPGAAQSMPKPAPVTPLSSFRAGVVFVMDSTISMQPYIDEARTAVKDIYKRIETAGLLDKVAFGLVGFRAPTADKERAEQLEYVASEFADPAEVASGEEFLRKAARLSEAKVSTDQFDEDAYAGVVEALEEVPWERFGARYIVLITDAGALEGQASQTGLRAEQVRSEAADKGVAVVVLHLKTPAGAKNHAHAEAQYRSLSDNPAIQKPLYFPVAMGSLARFKKAVATLGDAVAESIQGAARGEAVAGSALGAKTPAPKEEPEIARLRRLAQSLGHAMQLEYLGRMQRTRAPQVFEGWISDRDFADPSVRTVEERVLLTKNQLSDLQMILKEIVDAADRGVLEPDRFFDSLRSIAAQFGRDPSLARRPEARRLADLGLLGEYLEGLPYQSDVMNLDQETWSRWGPQRQYDFINKLKSKIRFYERYNADSGRWVSLAEGSPVGEWVYPVRLRDLP